MAGCWVFTTDDQFAPFNLELAEVFRAHGARFTAFVMLSTVANTGKLARVDIKALHDSGTVEIASHGNQHGFPMLSKESFSIWLAGGGAEPLEIFHTEGSVKGRFGRDEWQWPDNIAVSAFLLRLQAAFPRLRLGLWDDETGAFPIYELESGRAILTAESKTWEFRKGWTETQMRAIFSDSKTRLESWIGAPVTSYAFPYGASCGSSRRLVAEYYSQARVTDPGPSRVEVSRQPTLYKTRWNECSWFTRGQNSADRWSIPVSIDVRQRLYNLSSALRNGQVSRVEMPSRVAEIVTDTGGQNVVISDHNGAIDITVYDALLGELTNAGIPIKTFGEYAEEAF